MKNSNKVLTIAAAFCFAIVSAGCPTQPGQDPDFDRALNTGFDTGVNYARNGSDNARCEVLEGRSSNSLLDAELIREARRAGCQIGWGSYSFGLGMAEHNAPDTAGCAQYVAQVDAILEGYYHYRALTPAERTKVISACRAGYNENI